MIFIDLTAYLVEFSTFTYDLSFTFSLKVKELIYINIFKILSAIIVQIKK
nr:MAG TPA: hypothetical protein [Caudoviricetes sp.]